MSKGWVKNYKDAGFNDLMVKDDLIDKQSIGVNVNELVSPDQSSFNLRNGRNFRIFQQGVVDMTGSNTTVSVNHALGYIPSYLAYCKSSVLADGFNNLPYMLIGYDKNLNIVDLEIKMFVTLTSLTFIRNFTSANVHIYYYIFRENAN